MTKGDRTPAVVEAVEEPTTVVVPWTGEIVALDDPDAVAKTIVEAREIKRSIDSAVSLLTYALVAEANRIGKKTLATEAGTVSISGGSEIEWDVDELGKLLDFGLPEERYAELVQTQISYKVNAAVAKQIEASGNPAYARIVENARRRVERPYRASVRR